MSLLNSLFNRGLLGTRCKTCLSLAISRIKHLRNKRELQLKLMRKEIAQFLQTGQEPVARIRVEHIIREQNILAAYEILELFCEFVLARVPILETQRVCPAELQEAIASIIFAAPRCSDLPELMQVRNLLTAKYGKEFVSAASELRPDTSVNRAIIEKLSVKAPSADEKLRLLKEIAQEFSLEWDSSSTEAEFSKKHEDLLDGSNQACSRAANLQVPIAKSSFDVSPSKEGHSMASPNHNKGIQQVQPPTTSKASDFSSNTTSASSDRRAQPDNGNHKSGSSIDHLPSSQSNDVLEKARAAIAAAEHASASARAAAELVKIRVGH